MEIRKNTNLTGSRKRSQEKEIRKPVHALVDKMRRQSIPNQ